MGGDQSQPAAAPPKKHHAVKACPSVERALAFYTARYVHWTELRAGTPKLAIKRASRCPRYLLNIRRAKAEAARKLLGYWLTSTTLRDYEFADGNRAWSKAVHEVQRVFPGTESWLLSCSAAEGGHGRWVGYAGVAYSTGLRDSDTVGGPLQFRYSTFTGMFRRGAEYVRSRGYRMPSHLQDMTTAWRSALGQAIAGGWARYTGNDNSHWSASWGRGC